MYADLGLGQTIELDRDSRDGAELLLSHEYVALRVRGYLNGSRSRNRSENGSITPDETLYRHWTRGDGRGQTGLADRDATAYSYVENNPLVRVDPSGEKIDCVGVSGFAAFWFGVSGSVFWCSDDGVPPNSGWVICVGAGGGMGGAIGFGGVIGTGLLTDGWTGQLKGQGAVGDVTVETATTGNDICGGGKLGAGAGGAVTLEGCYKW